MAPEHFILVVLIGFVLGVLVGAFLRGGLAGVVINALLGIVGAALGAYLPVLIGQAPYVNTFDKTYLPRAIAGAVVLLVLAALFRRAKRPINR